MSWIQQIVTYVIAFLWGLNHKRKEDLSIFDDEFIGYEAFSLQTFMSLRLKKEHHNPALLKGVKGDYDLAPINNRWTQG